MLVLNCSRAFADFIEPNATPGKAPLILMPPAKAVVDDSLWLRDQDGQPATSLWQWQLHMVVVRRQPCVLAMEMDTRFNMLFTDLRKGDIAELLKQLLERLLNLQLFAAGDMGLVEDADLDGIIDCLFARHGDFRLVLRGNRSVQSHLNDVAYHLDREVDKRNGLPHGHERCAVFDDICNGMLRRSKSRPDWFFPAEEMLCYFMGQFAGWTPDRMVYLRERIKARRQQVWAEQGLHD